MKAIPTILNIALISILLSLSFVSTPLFWGLDNRSVDLYESLNVIPKDQIIFTFLKIYLRISYIHSIIYLFLQLYYKFNLLKKYLYKDIKMILKGFIPVFIANIITGFLYYCIISIRLSVTYGDENFVLIYPHLIPAAIGIGFLLSIGEIIIFALISYPLKKFKRRS